MKTKLRRPKPLRYRDSTTIAMVNGNEQRFQEIIHEGTVKHWVAIGWIAVRKATAEDRQRIREVK